MFFSWLEMDDSIPVYNSASVSKSVSNKELLDLGMKTLEQYPFDEMLWRPSIKFTTCFYYFYIATIIEQVLPAIFFDALLDLIGKPHKYEHVYRPTYLYIIGVLKNIMKTQKFVSTLRHYNIIYRWPFSWHILFTDCEIKTSYYYHSYLWLLTATSQHLWAPSDVAKGVIVRRTPLRF